MQEADNYTIRSLRDLDYFIKSDLYRYHGRYGRWLLLHELVWNPGFKFTFWMRVGCFLRFRRWLRPFYVMVRLLGNHYSVRYSIQIPFGTPIGPGFYIGHFGGIVVSGNSRIGKNCNLS